MTTDSVSQLVSFTEVLGFARRRAFLIFLGVALGGSLGFTGSRYAPKTYKSRATLTIQSSYFHHPLINDVVANIQDTAEMNSQRAALLRLALNDGFLESFGRNYISPSNASSNGDKPVDLQFIAKQIEYFPTNPTTFQISVTTSTPQTAVTATEAVVTQIVSTLKRERQQHLTRAKQALVDQAVELQGALSRHPSLAEGAADQSRIAATRSKLQALQEQLAETHPQIISLKNQLQALTSEAHEGPNLPVPDTQGIQRVFLFPQSRNTTQEIVDELLHKISRLTVVLYTDQESTHCSFVDIVEHPRLPTSPFAPNSAQFILIGVAAGLFVAMTLAIAGELRRHSKITPMEVEAFLSIARLGEIPALASCARTTLSTPSDHATETLSIS